MADDTQKNLKINIETVKTGQGAEQTSAELTKLTGATADAGKATGKLGEAHEETGHAAEHSEVSHRLLLKTFGQLGEAGRQVGESLIAMGEGPLGGLLILGIAINAVSEVLGQMDERIKAIRDHESELDTKVWEEQMEAADKAAEAANGYADKLSRIATETDKTKQAEELELAVLNAKLAALKAIQDAREKAELGGAGGDKGKEDEIRRRYASQASDADLAGEAARINLEENQRSVRAGASRGLKRTADSSESDYENLLKDPETLRNKQAFDEAQKEQEALDKKAGQYDIPGLTEKLKTASRVSGESGGASDYASIQSQLAEGKQAKQAAEDGRVMVEQLKSKVREDAAAVEKAKTAAEKAVEAYTRNQAAIDELTEKIKEQTAIYGVHKDTANTIKGIEAPGTPFGKAVQGEEGDALKVLHGQAGQVSGDSQDLMKQIGALMAGHSVTLQQAAQMISNANANAQAFTQSLDRMNGTAQSMEKFSSASAQKFGQIMSQIDANTRKLELLWQRPINQSHTGANAP